MTQQPPRILYVFNASVSGPELDLPPVFRAELERIGRLEIRCGAAMDEAALSAAIRESEFYLVCRHSAKIPEAIAADPGRLRLIVSVVGSLQPYVPRSVVASSVQVCNWGDAPADDVAAGTLTLLLAVLSDLHHHIMTRRRGEWQIDAQRHGGSLFGERVGLYGMGLIGRRFRELLAPFRCEVLVYDPYAVELPPDVVRAASLEELFSRCRIISIHAGLTAETRGSVTGELLARLSDDAVVINTGRGAIIDQEALFSELASGRLRAGLDVLDDPDSLPPDHPALRWENLILTGHQIHIGWPLHGRVPERLSRAEQYGVENMRSFLEGRELRWRITPTQFDRMT